MIRKQEEEEKHMMGNDEEIVPMHGKGVVDFQQEHDGEKQGAEEDKEEVLDEKDQTRVEQLKEYFDEDTLMKLFSKKW